MIYLFFNFWAIACLMMVDNFERAKKLQYLFILFAIIVISVLPAFQYGVGTDYFTYVDIFNGEKSLELFWKKEEFAFYFLVEFLRDIGFGSQSLFVSTSLISSALIVHSFRLLNFYGYRYCILFLCFFLMTGMLHNQMNGVRNYLAVYFFVAAIISKFSGRMLLALLFSGFGLMFHQTFYVMIPFILIPSKFYEILSSKIILVYFVLFLFWALGVPVAIIEYLLKTYLSFYSHYAEEVYHSSSLINVLTKAYYLPLHFWFIFWVSKNFKKLSRFQSRIFGLWVLSSSLYAGLMYSELFFRAYHYLVFFSIIPAYHFIMSRQHVSLKGMFLVYLVAPYFLKVIVFSSGEYGYSFYFFK